MTRTLPRQQPELPLPSQVIEPHVGDWRRLMVSQSARAASTADLAPPPPRPGSEAFLACPSRVGDQLRHRDGRVTDLAGNPITTRPNNYVFSTGHREFLQDTDRRFYAVDPA